LIACQTEDADLAAFVSGGVVHLEKDLSLRSR
jgi:hypothetical protein